MLEFGPELEIKLKKDKNLSDGQQYALGQQWQMAISPESSFPILSHRMTKRLTSPCNTVVRLLFYWMPRFCSFDFKSPISKL